MTPEPPSSRPNANDVTELEFELTDPSMFMVGLSGVDGCQVRLEDRLYEGPDIYAEIYSATGMTAEAIRDWAGQSADIEALAILSAEDNEVVFAVEAPGRGFQSTVEGAGAVLQSMTASGGIGRAMVVVMPWDDASAIIGPLCDQHAGVELVARRYSDPATVAFSRRGMRRRFRDQLTDRQWEVLETAYRNGYFERPRARTGEELAAELDISSATFSQHLRAAQRALFTILFDDLNAGRGG